MKTKKLVIFGIGDLAQIAYEYFTNDSEYQVIAFTVDKDYIPISGELLDLPVISFDRIEMQCPPESHDMYCAIVYGNINRDRATACKKAKDKRYSLASYVSSRAFVWGTEQASYGKAKIGEHCFIFEDNTVQPFVEIGNNCILWSGNHIGHHSVLGDNVFISSHVVVSGHCNIGNNCFVGVNSTLANNTQIGKETWVSHGSVLSGDIPEHSMVKLVTGNTETRPLNEMALANALERAKK